MRVPYERLDDVDEVIRRIRELSPATVLFDVEPLVAYWDTDATVLAEGVASVLKRLWPVSAIQVIGFTTNSSRQHDISGTRIGGTRIGGVRAGAGAGDGGPGVFYLASARKPLRLAPYRGLPRPGIVVGDQIATDGALANRLGYSFLHYLPTYEAPPGPRMMRILGVPLRRALFTPPNRDRSAGMSSDTDARA